MNGEQFVELPISPLEHEQFMYCARGFGMVVTIEGGKYLVKYDNISDLYELGRQIERITRYHSPLSERLKLSVKRG